MSKLTEELERLIEEADQERASVKMSDSVRFYTAGWLGGLREALKVVRDAEADPMANVDLTSELSVGDKVVSLINYMELERGVIGTVVDTNSMFSEYPIEVSFDKKINLFNTSPDNKLGFKRDELGKVGK